jgi:hypothetical protein
MGIGFRGGIIGILSSLVLMLFALYWDSTLTTNTVTGNSHLGIGLAELVVRLIETIGVTLFGLGLLNIVLETKDWRDYFEKRLRDLIVQQSYVSILDQDALNALQTNVLKAQFKDQKIDHEGSFLNYFHSNLHRYIAEPYRDAVTSEVIFKDGGPGCWSVFDRVTYVCRQSATGIQTHVGYMADKAEYVSIQSLCVRVQYPYNHAKKGTQDELYLGTPTLGEWLQIPLDAYKEVDGLIVTITAEYDVSKDKFQYWTMAHPTKNFDITVIYPPEYDIQVKPLVINQELVLTTAKDGYFKMKYDSWMLPASGLSWRIISRPESLAEKGVGDFSPL